MSADYAVLDGVILKVIRSSEGLTNFKVLSDPRVIEVLIPLSENTGKDDFRILDSRLRALKKLGQIRFEGQGKGWIFVPDGRPLLPPGEQQALERLRQHKVLRWIDLKPGGSEAQALNRLVKKGWATVHEDAITIRRWEIVS